MLATHSYLLVLYVCGGGFQDLFLCHLPRDQGEAELSPFPCVLFFSLLGERSDISFPTVLRHLLQSPQSFKDYQRWPQNDIRQLPHGHILSGPTELCRSSLLKYSFTWSCTRRKIFLVPDFLLVLLVKTDVKKISLINCTTQQWAHIFFSLPLATYVLREALLVFDIPYQFVSR